MSVARSEIGLEGVTAESNPREVTPSLYRELRRIAARHLNTERLNHTLQPTALVNEAYLKLAGERWYTDDTHFLAVASRVMRQVLVDYARSRSSQKRLGDRHFSLSDVGLDVRCQSGRALTDVLELDAALAALAEEEEALVRLVEMRFFGGMTAEESAEALGISAHIARHKLRYAQAWLRRKLEPRARLKVRGTSAAVASC